MRFEDSPHSKSIAYDKIVLDFGSYYLCGDFFIMEINEGEHFNGEKLNTLLDSLRAYYGTHKTLAYIANRVNAYSIDPVLWSYFDKDDSILIATCIISYRDSTYMSANIEKNIASIPMKRAFSLGEAINWVQNLKEFN
ncbi:hypothetical protein [Winogradskyella sp.]|uniref:hypothetical protein n=1 Tax=Winogradskyella sp. TaxID=1883156 RepID=UPI001B09774D|nr:hypothetical protein [Winogradskyella sp.]MBO6881008.1 hypothetical protein [Winogradskyella sp.]